MLPKPISESIVFSFAAKDAPEDQKVAEEESHACDLSAEQRE